MFNSAKYCANYKEEFPTLEETMHIKFRKTKATNTVLFTNRTDLRQRNGTRVSAMVSAEMREFPPPPPPTHTQRSDATLARSSTSDSDPGDVITTHNTGHTPQDVTVTAAEVDLNVISNLVEQDQREHKYQAMNLKSITNSRLHTPRKKDKLNLSEIYDLLFSTNHNSNTVKRLPVLTLNATMQHRPNETTTCILDSGCNVNLVQENLLPKGLKLNTKEIPKLISANNIPLKITGSLELILQIGKISTKDIFYVTPDLVSPVILGNSFLFQNSMELNYKNGTISITQGNKRHTINMDENWLIHIKSLSAHKVLDFHQIIEVKTTKDLVLAPNQHLEIQQFENTSPDVQIETDNNLRSKKKCHVYISKVNDSKQIAVNIYNASNYHKRVSKDTTVGFLVNNTTKNSSKSGFGNNTSIKNNPSKKTVTDKNGVIFEISPHLSVDTHNKVVDLLIKYRHMFTCNIEDLTEARVPPVKLELRPDAKPVNSPPYRQSEADRKELNKILDKLVDAKVLEECDPYTEYSSPAFITRNRDKEPRLVTDFRRINQTVIKSDNYPLPTVELVLSALKSAKVFSQLDCKAGFHQIPLQPESRKILAIKTETRLLRYRRVPMGLSTSTVIFSKVIQNILNKHLYNGCVFYVDDIISYDSTELGQIKKLDEILHDLDRANIKLNTKKCKFLFTETTILGHKISEKGISPSPNTVKAITEFKRPKTVRQVRQFIGASGFFRKFIKDYAKIAYPLSELIKDSNKEIPFKWTPECEQAFIKMKEILTNPPLLSHWKDDAEPIILVDASLTALGAVLMQKCPETSKLHPIYYLSKKFTPTQSRYSNIEREFLSLCYAVNFFRQYIYGRHTLVLTDCSALQFYKNFKHTTARLSKMALSLIDYDLTVKYIKGRDNLLPDCLSRNPADDETVDEELVDYPLHQINVVKQVDLPLLQNQDSYLKSIKLAKISPEAVTKKIRAQARKYTEIDNILYYKHFDGRDTKHLLAIPESLKEHILKTFHDAPMTGSHFSYFKTAKRIKEKYYWPNMGTDICQYTKTCAECQRRRTRTVKAYGFLQPQIPTIRPMERITIDFIGPITNSYNYKYIFTLTDACTRFAYATPVRSADAKTVARKLIEFCCIFGYPKIIVSDLGTHFCNNVLKHMTAALGITQHFSPPYTPQIQGSTERYNGILVTAISHYVTTRPQDWSKYVQIVTFSYNSTVNISTGYTPFKLMFGYEPILPTDLSLVPHDTDQDVLRNIKMINQVRQEMPSIIRKAQERQKYYFDQNRRDLQLKVGDEVLIQDDNKHTQKYNKFQAKFKGPYLVTAKLNPLTYAVQQLKYGKLVEQPVHVSRIRLFHKRI